MWVLSGKDDSRAEWGLCNICGREHYFWQRKNITHIRCVDGIGQFKKSFVSYRYEGTLCYKYQDNGVVKSGELEHIKIISQTGSSINVASFTKKQDGSLSSPSNNKGMYVETTQDGQHFNLIYNYLNEGSTEQGFPPHYGTEVVKFIKEDKNKEFSGRYFTNRTPFQTKGEFKNLKWVSNNKTHDF